MKKWNRKLIRGTNWALAGLMSLLGFSSCVGADEYGTPYAEYIVSGKVIDADGKGLDNIKITIPSIEHCSELQSGREPGTHVQTIEQHYELVYSKSNGEFEYNYNGWPSDTVKIKMKFEDLIKSTIEQDSTIVTFLRSELKGGKGWSEGKAKKKIQIELKRKP
ncbi:radical SAM-associated putative lipoprotein [Bacteroides sp. OttesenSCG-928-D19]|nr:radical SAM-associated putative lipoprotein [Bacteroides sp. OttesenSCG-928-D19]